MRPIFTAALFLLFTVLVMSSSAGVAIGVNEGVAIVLREAERYGTLAEQLPVFAIGVLAFGIVFQAGFAVVRLMMRLLSGPDSANAAS